MTDFQVYTLVVLGGYFLLMLGIAWYAGSKEDHAGFVLGNRNVGYLPTLGSLAASLRDGSGIVFWVGFGLTAGYGGLWLFIGVCFAFLFYVLCGPKVRALAAKENYVTIGELVRQQLGGVTEKVSSVIVLVVALMWIAAQLFVSGNLMAQILSAPEWVGVASVATVVALYLVTGGYGTVVKTDAIQFILIVSLVGVAFLFPPAQADLVNFSSLIEFDTRMSVAFFLFGFIFVLASPDMWQRVFSARDDRVIRTSFPLAGFFLILMTCSLLWLGMSAREYLSVDLAAGEVFFAIFEQQVFPAPILAFIALVTMAITMSTLDTFCYVFSSSLAKNILPKDISETRDKYVSFSRGVFVIVLAMMSILALAISDIIMFLFDAASLMTILAPVYVLAVLGVFKCSKRLDMLIALCVLSAACVYIFMFTQGYFEDFLMMLVPVALSTFLCVASLLVFRLGER